MTATRERRVAVVYKYVPEYRHRFFELARGEFASRGIGFDVIAGQPTGDDVAKRNAVVLPWATNVRNIEISVLGRTALWEPAFGRTRGAGLVVAEQASRLLVNYALQARYLAGGPPFAFWGHGRNFQPQGASRIGEAIKRRVSRHAHWWFAYNETSARVVEGLGFPRSRITIVQNAIDTTALRLARARVRDADLADLARSLGLVGENVAIFVGSIYPEKRIDFLLRCCRRLRDVVPNFEMLFIGAGVESGLVDRAARDFPWIRSLGPTFGDARAPYFALAKVMLMPGLVGLGILDSFAAVTPIVTMAVDFHSPEIEYLASGVNGVMVDAAESEQAYVDAVASVMCDPARLAALRAGCRVAAATYTVEAMVRRFCDGAEQALARE